MSQPRVTLIRPPQVIGKTNYQAAFGGDTRIAEIVVGHTGKQMMLRYNKLRQQHEERIRLELQNENLKELEIKAVVF